LKQEVRPVPQKAYLTLENGVVFEGFSFGAAGEVIGETVFTTGMTGYLETLTDKSYYGQIITQTFPLIGNYGVIPEDFESSGISAKGYIVKHWCQDPSNFRSEGELDIFLKQNNVVGLYGIDTRRLTKIIRESGVMNGRISSLPPDGKLGEIKAYRIRDAVQTASCKEITVRQAGETQGRPLSHFKVALLDYGLKENIRRELIARGCEVTTYPQDTAASTVISGKHDGIMLSNGPGDPDAPENAEIIKNLQTLCGSGIPIFGICLGHQLLALAHGFRTEKLKYGHRGANQPAKDLASGRTYITSQNHGYAVESGSIAPLVATQQWINVNDGTCEGIEYLSEPVFSVQFHPEACGGPRDTSFLFDRFLARMEGN
jgi:carbamoyl-phosphate synthase small subunit